MSEGWVFGMGEGYHVSLNFCVPRRLPDFGFFWCGFKFESVNGGARIGKM